MFKVNKPSNTYCYKYGLDEMPSLKSEMIRSLNPIKKILEDRIYWTDSINLKNVEYKGRDGFIPYKDNCGGIEIMQIIPMCELHKFNFIPRTECDYSFTGCQCENTCVCDKEHECDEHCDHKLRIWFKFEGLDNKGNGQFWLYCGGGNGDAPYFRVKHEEDIFEHSFKAKNVADFKIKAKKAVSKLLKVMS